MTDIIIIVQFAAVITSALLIWACLVGAMTYQEQSFETSRMPHAEIVRQHEERTHGPFSKFSKNDACGEHGVKLDGSAYEPNFATQTSKVLATIS